MQFTALALGSGTQALDHTAKALTTEIERQPIFSATQPAPGQLTVSALFNVDPAAAYSVTEIGLIGDGVVFGVWSTTDPTQALVVRTPGVPYTSTITVGYAQLPSQNVSVVIQPLDAAAQQLVNDAVINGINAHVAAADPHPQYVSGTVDQHAKPAAWRGQAVANLGLPVDGLQTAGKINAVNNPNLLFNGSAEFGSVGWVSSNFQWLTGDFGEGSFWDNATAINGATVQDMSGAIPVFPNTTLSLSADLYALGVTVGRAYVYMEAFTSAGVSLGGFGSAIAVNGTNWTRYAVSGTTPANTDHVVVHRVIDTAPTVTAGGVAFRRIKLEQGTTPSLYSQEATIGQLMGRTNGKSANVYYSGVPTSGSATTFAKSLASFVAPSNGFVLAIQAANMGGTNQPGTVNNTVNITGSVSGSARGADSCPTSMMNLASLSVVAGETVIVSGSTVSNGATGSWLNIGINLGYTFTPSN
ncbi:hypothetical protein [Paraburkholderia sp.]|uniref:hypothetical protein n=1 Tax=Paraburkholderia sp. TaxID=1926495 RepID=UPI003D6E922B